jgi:methylmalonyl-CoA mutase
MEDWKYTFDPVSKAEWFRQITSDLKQKSVESLIGEWWEGEPRWPVVHADDMTRELVRLPDFLFRQPPQIIEQISTPSISTETVNKTILEALQFGAQSIILQLPSTPVDFNAQWIKDVRLDWITFYIEPEADTTDLKPELIRNLPEPILIRIQRSDSSKPLSSILQREHSTSTVDISPIRFVYHFPSTGNWTEKTTVTLNAFMNDLEEWNANGFEPSAFFNQCILTVEADPDYFKQIIQTRTLHVLWQNLNQYHSKDVLFVNGRYLEIHIDQKKNEKPDLFLIRASMSALAASLAGTGSLCIHHSIDDNVPLFYRRINRNIQHLLELESGMYKGIDPLAGAFSMDFQIKRWVAKIWDGMNPGK